MQSKDNKMSNWQPVSQNVTARITGISGLFEFQLDVRGDNRGWFKENYQRAKILNALEAINAVDYDALKNFNIVQNNVSFNKQRGVARGIHAEPWDKFISIAHGEAFAAIVDLRKGDSFGKVETFYLNPNNAIFVPKGCGNSFQALTDDVAYTYLVNAHWSADAKYIFVNLLDPTLNIQWPIPIVGDFISDKDAAHPPLSQVTPIEVSRG